MTKPIHLYLLSRIPDAIPFTRVEKHASGRDEIKRTQSHEIESLRRLADELLAAGVPIDALDGFFLGYSIPHIGKEFDLLKFTSDRCLNIELKSRSVPVADIREQLDKNRYYLGHLQKETTFFTVVTDTMTVYTCTDAGVFAKSDFASVARAVCAMQDGALLQIDNLFRASDYLVSPLHTPQRFIAGEYFLTQAQEQIKRKVLADITTPADSGFYSLIGRPGTGKTLLLYDIAKSFAACADTLVIHCGEMQNAQRILSASIPHFRVETAESVWADAEKLAAGRYILVDESHRMEPRLFAMLCAHVREAGKVCIFSSDPEQVLSCFEAKNAIVEAILALPLRNRYELSEKIRANRELSSFIAAVRNLRRKPSVPVCSDSIALSYAANPAEAGRIIEHYRRRGYTFINYTRQSGDVSPYAAYEEDFDVHHVVGQEFERVVMLMDQSFFYDSEGILQGVPHPSPEYLYPNLFYVGITRVREKLALVILDAPDLFERITSILA